MDIKLPTGLYRKRAIVEESSSLRDSEMFSSVSGFGQNLYMGTSTGQLLHYHRFDDSPGFLLISQQHLRNSPITQILVVTKSNRAVALCGGVLYLFSLPELSPLQSGKLRDVEHISLFHQSDIIMVAKDKLRIIRFLGSEVKLVKAVSDISASKAVGHYSNNLITYATLHEYSIVNPEDGNRTPLFEYDTEGKVVPNMVAFQPPDTEKEEILLTIRSDTNTSIGMFISATGDPTRGTLSWINKRYPNGGIAVQWPYVFGIFDDKFIVSSLEDLSIIAEHEIEGTLINIPNPVSVDNEAYSLKGVSAISIDSDLVVFDAKAVYVVYKETAVNLFLEDLISLIKGQSSSISLLENETDPLYNELLFLYLVFNKEFAKLEAFADATYQDLIICLYTGDEGKHAFYRGVERVIDVLRPHLDDHFRAFAFKSIQQTYLKSHQLDLQLIAYSSFDTSTEFIDFVKKDTKSWNSPTDQLNSIIRDLESKNLHTAVLYSYILLKEDEKICSLSVKFLTGEYTDSHHFQLTNLILDSLDKLEDPKIYRDALLEVLRVDSKRGISYIKKHVNGKHKKTHNEIISQVNNLATDEDYAQLKLEVIENSYRDKSASAEELLEHLLGMLKSPNEVAVNNFGILYQTYLIENTFGTHKPISSWVGFLQSIMDTTECRNFIEIYLKTFEILNFTGTSHLSELEFVGDNSIYDFFRCCFTDDDKVSGLLDFRDYFSAEFYCIYGKPPYPPHKYYVCEDLKPIDGYKHLLQKVFHTYKTNENNQAIRHFINTYGGIYTPGEIIDMLPSNLSLAYVQDYFINQPPIYRFGY
ncbi:hypothetical protein PSN45_004675 [Yamadazyma tenuis]|uniref:uncharacterized protein n=1 Tax=Candida tenuis TaxID=2315449 RepID=UPI0027A9A282|nr:hypothetical protein PSN45_004675 [Yamadazyma tenuis]